MEIKFENGYTLTTNHPASHYGLGVLLDYNDNPVGVNDHCPSNKNLENYFGLNATLTGGELVVIQSTQKLYSLEESNFMRGYLAQSPNPYPMLEGVKLLQKQADAQLEIIMGDTTQGVAEPYWREGKAKIARMVYEITNGEYTTDENCVITKGG
jgi:hypothetical protein